MSASYAYFEELMLKRRVGEDVAPQTEVSGSDGDDGPSCPSFDKHSVSTGSNLESAIIASWKLDAEIMGPVWKSYHGEGSLAKLVQT